jgi:PAS domain S-box-containing protein
MNSTEQLQLQRTLLSRCHVTADAWYKAIARTSFVPFKAVEVRQHLVGLTEEAIALLLAESLDHDGAKAIGASLASLHYLEPEALGGTQEVLAQQLVEGLPAEQVAELQPRLAALLGGLATGFSHQARETILTEQDWIRGALRRELQRVENALRTAYDEVEQQVWDRTAELRDANQSLQREIVERKQVEEALRESEERFKGIFENTTIGLYRTTPDGRILMANPALARMLGYPSFDELAQRNLEEKGFEPEYLRSAFKQRIEDEEQVFGLESAWVRHDGITLFVRESARAVRDEAQSTTDLSFGVG